MTTQVALICLLAVFGASGVSAVHLSVSNKTLLGPYCIILDAENVTFVIPVPGKPDIQIDLSEGETLKNSSMCGVDYQILNASFLAKVNTATAKNSWKMSMNFTREGSGFKLTSYWLNGSFEGIPFTLTNRTGNFTYSTAKNANIDAKTSGANHAFHCSTVPLALWNETARIEFKNLTLSAFGNFTKDKNPPDTEWELCALDEKTSDVVPIVVGACLAALVIVVLVAYLIGRARAKRQGYASV